MKFKIILSAIILVVACSCNKVKAPANILPQDSMKVIILDFLIADEWNNVQGVMDTTFRKIKSNNVKAYQKVLEIHHISKAQFYNSFAYYEEHPDKFKALMDSVYAYGKKLADSALHKFANPAVKKKFN